MVNRPYDEEQSSRLNLARIAAPVGFFVAVTALVLIVHSSLGSSTKPDQQAAATAPAGGVAGTSTTAGKTAKKKKRFYRVKNGDTLDAIAIKFHTDVDTLLKLNPKADQYNLSPGERLRVR